MGVEPTHRARARHNGFEGRGSHRTPSTSVSFYFMECLQKVKPFESIHFKSCLFLSGISFRWLVTQIEYDLCVDLDKFFFHRNLLLGTSNGMIQATCFHNLSE